MASSTRPMSGSTARTSVIRRATSSPIPSMSPSSPVCRRSMFSRSRSRARRTDRTEAGETSPASSSNGTQQIRRGIRGGSGGPFESRRPGPSASIVSGCCAATLTRPALISACTAGSTATRRERCGYEPPSEEPCSPRWSSRSHAAQTRSTGRSTSTTRNCGGRGRSANSHSQRSRSMSSSTVRSATPACCAPGCARSRCRTGCGRSTASGCSSRVPTSHRPDSTLPR